MTSPPRWELLGVPVEETGFLPEIEDPEVDADLPRGRARLTATPDRALLRVRGVGTFVVEDGARIGLVAPADPSSEDVLSWLRGPVAILLLGQRGEFALHASAVQIGDAVVAVCGPNGAGKSVTVLRLEQRGHTLVSDDVSVVRGSAPLTIETVGRPPRVQPASAERLGLDVSRARQIPGDHKLRFPPPGVSPRPLAALAVLEPGGMPEVTVARLRGAEAHLAVARNTYRGASFRPTWRTELFEWTARISRAAPMYRISRPLEGWTVDAVADAVEEIAALSPCWGHAPGS